MVLRTATWALLLFGLVLAGLADETTQEFLAALLVGLALVALSAVRPGRALVVLVVGLPAAVPLLALAYKLGAPAGLVRGLGSFKEAILVGLVVAAVRELGRRRQRPDILDIMSISFVALVVVYFLLQIVAAPVVGTLFPAAPGGLYNALLAIRVDVGFVAVLLAVRTIRIDEHERRLAISAAVAVGVLVAAGAIVEFFASETWFWFSHDILGIDAYKADVFSDPQGRASTVSVIGGREFTRASSFLGQLSLGPFLFTSMGILIARVAVRPTSRTVAALGVVVMGIVVTITRSAVLGALVGALVTARSFPGASARVKRRLAAGAGAVLIVVVALAGVTGLADRTLAAIRGEDDSTELHDQALEAGWQATLDHPEGHGLGYQPFVFQRTEQNRPFLVAESSYLQVSIELGIIGGILFVGMVVGLLRGLNGRRGDPLAAGMQGAVVAMAVNGLFLHAWFYLQGSWTMMAIAGLTIPRPDAVDEEVGRRTEDGDEKVILIRPRVGVSASG